MGVDARARNDALDAMAAPEHPGFSGRDCPTREAWVEAAFSTPSALEADTAAATDQA
jgi:hypothetical protein